MGGAESGQRNDRVAAGESEAGREALAGLSDGSEKVVWTPFLPSFHASAG